MKLYYRGASYECNPHSVANREVQQPFQPSARRGTAYNLMYRGVSYHVDPSAPMEDTTQPSVTYKLSFRGINYLVNRNIQGKVSLV
ncbi:DUF4278 domain-containing protein [Nostoc sp. TCL26-01]|uniref:DUF4278 domain-containing protein n=1 Tax=Nostoc sp. TCL26-01 TaxID=2576904 RepID=UPI0015BB6EB2|nr:DUF4278 domain-containing protein [Nostoc sp. TCL26-01]QLE57047.1 DUF4278 domain-containing protein [Nostoc sp. TCL26-01]